MPGANDQITRTFQELSKASLIYFSLIKETSREYGWGHQQLRISTSKDLGPVFGVCDGEPTFLPNS